MTDEDRSPKFFALHVETSSKFIGGCDLFLTIILAANVLSCLFYDTAWLNLAIGTLTLSAAILTLVSLWLAFTHKESIYLIVPIIFQAITLCWCIILVLAGIFSVTSGHLWPLQSLIGIKPPEIKVSKDVRDDNYISPDDTNPETNRAIVFGQISIFAALFLFVFKLWAFVVLKMVYRYYLQYDIYDQYTYANSKYAKVSQKDYHHEEYDDEEDYPYDPEDFEEDDQL
uniref:Uncharacterized protein n=1 Tax=Panagrolaimus sp. ES5 TaxID=591445 RepID=A0AC34GTG6_9BILA